MKPKPLACQGFRGTETLFGTTFRTRMQSAGDV